MADGNSRIEKDTNSAQFKCKICHASFMDENHLESKEHIKNVMKQKYGKKYLEAKEMLDEKHSDNTKSVTNFKTEEKSKAYDSDTEDDSDSDADDVYTCHVCEKICTGKLNYDLHIAGSKHKKKLKQIKTMNDLKGKNMNPRTPDAQILGQIMKTTMFASSDLICEVCNVKCTGPGVYKQHCEGEAHKKKKEKLRILREMGAEGMPATANDEELEESYSCDLCSKVFTGVLPYKQHLDSLSHKKQERNNQTFDKVKDLCITSPQNSKLKCKECNKTFSGPTPFKAHLKSSSHGKLKKKSDLYEELEKNYPEMLKTSIKEDSDSDESDEESVKPACGICTMIFTGPETALEHFASDKHKKALKKKKRIEKKKRISKLEADLRPNDVAKQESKIISSELAHDESISDDSFEEIGNSF